MPSRSGASAARTAWEHPILPVDPSLTSKRFSLGLPDLVKTGDRTGREATMAEPVTGTTESSSFSNGSGSQPVVQPTEPPGEGRQTKQLVIGLLIALFLVSIMATTYISAEHLPVAHNLPWGVTGPSSLTTAVQHDTNLEIHQYANQAE